jgi:hypothetical protein
VIYTLVESTAILSPVVPTDVVGKYVYERSEPVELYFNTNIFHPVPAEAGKVRPDTTAGGKPIVYIWVVPPVY